MKKLLFATLVLSVLSSCKKEVIKQGEVLEGENIEVGSWHNVRRYEIRESGMNYILYRDFSGGLAIINITKDSLNVALLKKQLNNNANPEKR